MNTVVAGILERDEKTLICRRRADQSHALKWEFPGGKVEPDELPETAIVRELLEELGIESVCGPELMRYQFAHPGKRSILLIFFSIKDWQGAIENRIFDRIEWVDRDQLRKFDFLEGDEMFINFYLPGTENATL